MRVSEIARRLKVSPDTVRYYTRIQLVRPTKSDNGYKDYSEGDFHKLRFAIRAKALGFHLSDIKKLIETSEHGKTPCPEARRIIAENLEVLAASIQESINLYERMESAVLDWQGKPDKLPSGDTICSLIEDWSGEEEHV